ncbi:hypothetical protein BDV95DRAFT_602165 [Massariosphaeria phaeospora]|uniref:Uncharacterized protein n=1 Tax=Massariosphaeria phaeospora TaxID=100035 RepID=A0A7C8ICK5_9PLEO|nr:hypothetical protein BDV95DRAFT_602165 [Massariosphaeria phaeospora]
MHSNNLVTLTLFLTGSALAALPLDLKALAAAGNFLDGQPANKTIDQVCNTLTSVGYGNSGNLTTTNSVCYQPSDSPSPTYYFGISLSQDNVHAPAAYPDGVNCRENFGFAVEHLVLHGNVTYMGLIGAWPWNYNIHIYEDANKPPVGNYSLGTCSGEPLHLAVS